MTEKTIKKSKNFNKIKNEKVKSKPISSDSDFNDSDSNEFEGKDGKQNLKQLTADVSQLLQSLQKEHGLDLKGDETKNKKTKINANPNAKQLKQPKSKPEKNPVEIKKIKKEKKPIADVKPLTKENETPLVKSANIEKKKNKKNKKQNAVEIKAEPIAGSPKKKNQKRKATDAPDNEPGKKKNKKQKKATQNANSNAVATGKKDVTKSPMKSAQENDSTENEHEKKEHHLQNAHPVLVSNLPTNIKRKQVLNTFKKFGKIVSIRFRTNTGKSFYSRAQLKGVPYVIAFVYFETVDAAKSSLIMNQEKFHDRVLTVDLDSRDISSKVKPKCTILVGNLKYDVSQELLHETFKCCGKIDYVRVIQTDRGCKGVAFVCFISPDAVPLALELNGTEILGRQMHVERYKESKLKRSDKLTTLFLKKNKSDPGIQAKKIFKKKNKTNPANPNAMKQTDGGKKKKNKQFTGVKSNEAKTAQEKKNKNKKMKKKKMNDQKRLSMKIAPRDVKPEKIAE